MEGNPSKNNFIKYQKIFRSITINRFYKNFLIFARSKFNFDSFEELQRLKNARTVTTFKSNNTFLL